MIDLQPGDHVICIDARFHPTIACLYKALPRQDEHYVVRDVLLGMTYSSKGKEGTVRLLLVGLHNPLAGKSKDTERGFNAERFRKLDEMKTQQTKTNEIQKTTFRF